MIRRGTEDDWEAICNTFVRAGRVAWSHILSPEALSNLTPSERWHPRTGGKVLVAERAGQVAGFVCVRSSADADADQTVGEIDALYVHPAAWGKGLGQALLTTAVADLAATGFACATLWTEYRNERPLRFYRAAGWLLDGAERRRTLLGAELLELRHRRAL
jgi:GNAT superfamily N-acetyltransferase